MPRFRPPDRPGPQPVRLHHPVTSQMLYTDEQRTWMRAMYRLQAVRHHVLTGAEILQEALRLGYRLVAPATVLPRFGRRGKR